MWCRWCMLTLFLAMACLQALPAVFVVSSNADSGPGTLRDALTQAAANGSATQDIINFNLPGSGTQALTIKLFTQLPEVTSNLVIDGSSQPGPKLGNSDAKVYIMPDVSYTFPGTKAAALVMTETSNVDIYGLCIKGYDSRLINFNGNLLFTAISAYDCVNVTIGSPGKGNVLVDNIYGIYGGTASLTDSKNNTNFIIESNFIGYDESGTNVVELGYAIDLTGDDCFIGGPDAADRNYFAKNISVNGSGNSLVNNSLSLDIQGQDHRDNGASILIKISGSNARIRNNDFCSTLFQFIDLSQFLFTGNRQSTLPGNCSIYLSNCNSGFIGGDADADMNYFNNDGGAIYASQSSAISILKNSISCNNKAYTISNGFGAPKINVLVNSTTEFSGTGSPGATVYIYNDNSSCSICNPVEFLSTLTVDAGGNWKLTGDFSNKKLIANALLGGYSSEFTQPAISSDPADHDIVQPTCNLNNGSITLKNLRNISLVSWYDSNNRFIKNGNILDGVGAGVYYAKCFSGTCSAQSTNFTLNNTDLQIFDYNLVKQNAHCGLKNGSIKGLTPPTVPNATISEVWTDQNGVVAGYTMDLDNLGPGTYMLSLSVNDCKIPYGPVIITDAPITIPTPLVNNTKLCAPGEATIAVINPSTAGTYRLYDSESAINALQEQAGGIFKVQLTSNSSYYISQYIEGCESDRAKIDITVGLSALSIANAITPNADGVNDYWQITGIENYPKAAVSIFNRNGQLVFESKGYSKPFTGVYNNQKLPAGVYYYIINLIAGCTMLSGSLTLIR